MSNKVIYTKLAEKRQQETAGPTTTVSYRIVNKHSLQLKANNRSPFMTMSYYPTRNKFENMDPSGCYHNGEKETIN